MKNQYETQNKKILEQIQQLKDSLKKKDLEIQQANEFQLKFNSILEKLNKNESELNL